MALRIQGQLVPSETDGIFKKEDINATSNTLARLLRSIFVDKSISYKMLQKMHNELMNRIGADPSIVSYSYNNFKKSIIKQKLTWQMLSYAITGVLNQKIKSISIVTEDDDGKEQIYTIDI